jgi:hypothetical protein
MSTNHAVPHDLACFAAPATPPRLLDHLHRLAQARGYPAGAAPAFVDWAHRFILFDGKRHRR